MALTLYMHPLSSYCHKALVALYENATPFTAHSVNLGDATEREAFRKIWPIGKFPVLRDDARDRTVPESTTIIEYLQRHYPGPAKLLPEDPERAAEVRSVDRFYDLYVHHPMQSVVGDRIRPADKRDPLGVEQARDRLRTALRMVEREMADAVWAVGGSFSMADCSASPALFYANKVMPLAEEFPVAHAYLQRLVKRPSYARALREAEPYMSMFPA
ncbi:MAG TPA: glutathione S-transferase family protein [Steroidobacteraceae bacterium]|jgi:glutathione S-transferase